jgi:hypothetical protein
MGVHTKGGTPAMHEWRPMLGQMLRELVAQRRHEAARRRLEKSAARFARPTKNGDPLEMDSPKAGSGPMSCPSNTANSPASSAAAGSPKRAQKKTV